MRRVPDMRPHFDGRLYHVTGRDVAKALMLSGFEAKRSYWSVGTPISDYYHELVDDDDLDPVILSVDLADLDEALLVPDMPSIEEPPTLTLQTTEELVYGAWQQCKGTWRDCLNLVGSVAYDGAIPASLLRIEE